MEAVGGPVTVTVNVTVNGQSFRREVEPRLLLSDFLRHELDLTGTHVGCEHGVCGACTVLVGGGLLDGGLLGGREQERVPVRSCLLFAVQADGLEIVTVEGLASETGELHPLQQAFRDCHALQCGFCTPGMLLSLVSFLEDCPRPREVEVREAISGHLCRCTGYQSIVDAVLQVAGAAGVTAAAGQSAE